MRNNIEETQSNIKTVRKELRTRMEEVEESKAPSIIKDYLELCVLPELMATQHISQDGGRALGEIVSTIKVLDNLADYKG